MGRGAHLNHSACAKDIAITIALMARDKLFIAMRDVLAIANILN